MIVIWFRSKRLDSFVTVTVCRLLLRDRPSGTSACRTSYKAVCYNGHCIIELRESWRRRESIARISTALVILFRRRVRLFMERLLLFRQVRKERDQNSLLANLREKIHSTRWLSGRTAEQVSQLQGKEPSSDSGGL